MTVIASKCRVIVNKKKKKKKKKNKKTKKTKKKLKQPFNRKSYNILFLYRINVLI